MRTIALLFIGILFSIKLYSQTSKPKVWTKKFEQEVYNSMYKVADSLFTDEGQKRDYSRYAVEKLKLAFPNGVDNVPEDSIKKVMYRIGVSYGKHSKSLTLKKWTPEYEAIIKRDLFYNPALNGLTDKTKKLFCDCYVTELKIIYPNGVSDKVPKDTQEKLAKTCIAKIKNSN